MYVCVACVATALWLLGLILCFGSMLLSINSGWGRWWLAGWLAPASSFLLEAMPLLLCLFLCMSARRNSLMLFLSLPAASPKGLSGTECLDVPLLLLLLKLLLYMWVSGCWKPAAGRVSTILFLDLNSPVELRARDDLQAMWAGGEGSGRVTVITKIMRKRRKRGVRSRIHLWPHQSLDHTRQACG